MKKVYFNDYFMTRFLFENLEVGNDVRIFEVSNFIKHRKLPFLFKFIKVRFFPFLYLLLFYIKRMLKIEKNNKFDNDNDNDNDNDVVLYFSVENMYELTWLLYHNRTVRRHVLWIWNPVSSLGRNKYDKWIYLHLFIPTLKLVGVELWSFDKADVNNFMFTYHPQIHNSYGLIESDCRSASSLFSLAEKKFLFVGLDKGRLKKLAKLKSVLSGFNAICDLHVTKDVGKEYTKVDSLVVKDCYLPYAEYLEKISNSFGLIDFVQNGQSGLTLRVLEAIFLRKKLITNNESVKEYDFYNPSNILIVDENIDFDKLSLFLDSDFVEIDDKILEKYDLRHLLKSVFN